MDVEIRPITPAEVDAFLAVSPVSSGLPFWEPEPSAWWPGPEVAPPFGGPPDQAELDRYRSELSELDRTRAAFVAGKLAGTSATLSLEVTIPGAGPVPMGGVTSVGVLATHRRQGLLRAMMRGLLDDGRDRGEMLACLGASQGGIYGRFGFGPATSMVRWELDRTQARLAWPTESQDRLELVDPPVAREILPSLHERVRPARTGEVSAAPGLWDALVSPLDGTRGTKRFVVHSGPDGAADGLAVYRLPWSPDRATSGTVEVDHLEAASPAAYTALWAFLADLDLTRRVVAGKRPVDEAFRWRLADPRALRVTRLADRLWVRLIDVPRALAARSYQVAGALVIEVSDEFCPWNAGRWRLDGGPEGGSCDRAPAGAQPDLSLSASALGCLYLGGTAPGPLARAGLVRELVPGTLRRARPCSARTKRRTRPSASEHAAPPGTPAPPGPRAAPDQCHRGTAGGALLLLRGDRPGHVRRGDDHQPAARRPPSGDPPVRSHGGDRPPPSHPGSLSQDAAGTGP